MNTYSIHDHGKHGQHLTLVNRSHIENRVDEHNSNSTNVSNQEIPLFGHPQMPASSLSHKIALIQSRSALKILEVVYKATPNPLLTTEIAEKARIHRATTSLHAKYLVDLNLIQYTIQPGTEKKHKPTYLYTLSPDVDKDELFNILSVKIQADPSIADINKGESHYPNSTVALNEIISEDINEISSSMKPEFTVNIGDSDSDSDSDDDDDFTSLEEQSFEQQISAILTKMAEEIVSLQNRVTELEQKSTQRVEQRKQLDLSQAMKILDSRNTKK